MKSIKTKLVLYVCILFITIGLLIFIPLLKFLPALITSHILNRDAKIAQYISERAEKMLLLGNKVGLLLYMRDNLRRLDDARYLFITDKNGNIVAHTFSNGFPEDLLHLKKDKNNPVNISRLSVNSKDFYNISVPVLNGELGFLNMGISMESNKKDIIPVSKIIFYVGMLITVGLGVGILLFIFLGVMFSNAIIRIRDFARRIGEGNLDERIEMDCRDELGDLALSLNDMAARLKGKIEEIRTLEARRERCRIAFDLHDNCVQDIAAIVKRLELCERLIRDDRPRALKEISFLKETVRTILTKTRETIFELRSDAGFNSNLGTLLRECLASFKKETGIHINASIPEEACSINGRGAKNIYYIVKEAFTNIKKHSRATSASIDIGVDGGGTLYVNISDDGIGFDIASVSRNSTSGRAVGITSMSERAAELGGELKIESQPGTGTLLRLAVPLSGSGQHA